MTWAPNTIAPNFRRGSDPNPFDLINRIIKGFNSAFQLLIQLNEIQNYSFYILFFMLPSVVVKLVAAMVGITGGSTGAAAAAKAYKRINII